MRDNFGKCIRRGQHNNTNLTKVDVVKLIINKVILNVYICTGQNKRFKSKVNLKELGKDIIMSSLQQLNNN